MGKVFFVLFFMKKYERNVATKRATYSFGGKIIERDKRYNL